MSQYAANYYNVPSDIGRRVTVNGKPGIIAEDRGHYIGVNFDANKPGDIRNCHPTDHVIYLEMGTIRKLTRSQARYARYRDISDCFESFADFLKYEKHLEAQS